MGKRKSTNSGTGAVCRPRKRDRQQAENARRLEQALEHHHSGRLEQAEALYREVLATDARQPDALHLLGLIASERGSHELAVDLIRAAIRANPKAPLFHSNLGMAANRKGDWRQALLAYTRALELNPRDPRPLVELGRTFEQQGQSADALVAYREAQQLDPGLVEAVRLEASLLRRSGLTYQAALVYRRAIEKDPHDWQTHHDLANLLMLDGRWEEAEMHYGAALETNPDRCAAHFHLGLAMSRRGNWTGAALEFERALGHDRARAGLQHEFGNALHVLGRLEQAEAAYRAALALEPERAETHFNLGVTLTRLRRFGEAIECYQKAIALRPEYAEAQNNLANLLQLSGRLEEALEGYSTAVAAAPDWLEARYNRALALQEQGSLEQAAEAYREVLERDPRRQDAANNLANTLMSLRRPDEATECYGRVLATPGLDAHTAQRARWNLSLAQLLCGDFRTGWEGYDARLEASPTSQRQKPEWTGGEFRGRTMLAWTEQGLGDAIQFVRYLDLVKPLGGSVLLECRPEMASLFRESALADCVVERGSALPEHDVQAALMSLPRVFGTTLETIPARVPYLRAGADKVAHWAQRLGAARRRIGVVWAGNPAHQNDRNRSMSLRDLAPLANVPGMAWFSLQKGPQASEIAECEWPALDDLGPELDDLSDSAAALVSLDLVISVDTMVAHLAGALARPVWTLLPYAPDWRWLLERGDSPWYPTMRLFRQPALGDWASVVEQVRQALLRGD